MSMSVRRAFRYVVVPFLVLTALGSLTFYFVHWVSSRNGLKLASIVVAAEPSALAWSPDGSYLAVGTMNSSRTRYGGIHAVGGNEPEGPGKVFIVDIGTESVTATIETVLGVTALAFSPDGRWLSVATRDFGAGKAEAELVVFAVPEFAPRHRAKSSGAKPGYFQDLAWGADSKSLHAIDHGPEKGANVRRWTVPEFVEQRAISIDSGQIDALAAAPDGLTVVVVQHKGTANGAEQGTVTLRLFNLEKGTEIWSCKEDPFGSDLMLHFDPGPVGFTADSKAVGVLRPAYFRNIGGRWGKANIGGKPQWVSWWDVGTGKAAQPAQARFAVQPASLAESRDQALAPDFRTWASAWNGQGAGRSGMDSPEAGVHLSQSDPVRDWYWDFEKMGCQLRGNLWAIPGPPALAFSPDGKKLAGALRLPSGWTIAIWAIP